MEEVLKKLESLVSAVSISRNICSNIIEENRKLVKRVESLESRLEALENESRNG